MARQWDSIQLRITAGFGHDIDEIPGPGDFILPCIACGLPGFNMSDDWKEKQEIDPLAFTFHLCKPS